MDFIEIKAGGKKPIQEVRSWFKQGVLNLRSSAASEIATTLTHVKANLHCPLILGALPTHFLEGTTMTDQNPAEVEITTANRLFSKIINQGQKEWGARLCRLPWKKDELKAHLKRRYLSEEQRIMSLLAMEGSLACQVQAQLHLTRASIKAVLESLDDCR